MSSTIKISDKEYLTNLSQPIDLSLPITHDGGVGAWYIDQPEIIHVEVDGYVGNVSLGGSTNFNDIAFNPHSHGTHTECIGHITEEFYSVNDALDKHFFLAQLITVDPMEMNGDQVITPEMFDHLNPLIEAVIIRTLPNTTDKKTKNYSNTNPPYLLESAASRFCETRTERSRSGGIRHLLIDLPSVDKEKDNGELKAHKAFFDFHGSKDSNATITEFIYVPDQVEDGLYILNLQVAPFVNDAAPSRPVIYKVLDE
jgi:kynurenine formamidase